MCTFVESCCNVLPLFKLTRFSCCLSEIQLTDGRICYLPNLRAAVVSGWIPSGSVIDRRITSTASERKRLEQIQSAAPHNYRYLVGCMVCRRKIKRAAFLGATSRFYMASERRQLTRIQHGESQSSLNTSTVASSRPPYKCYVGSALIDTFLQVVRRKEHCHWSWDRAKGALAG